MTVRQDWEENGVPVRRWGFVCTKVHGTCKYFGGGIALGKNNYKGQEIAGRDFRMVQKLTHILRDDDADLNSTSIYAHPPWAIYQITRPGSWIVTSRGNYSLVHKERMTAGYHTEIKDCDLWLSETTSAWNRTQDSFALDLFDWYNLPDCSIAWYKDVELVSYISIVCSISFIHYVFVCDRLHCLTLILPVVLPFYDSLLGLLWGQDEDWRGRLEEVHCPVY
jgi:hypothetical protein